MAAATNTSALKLDLPNLKGYPLLLRSWLKLSPDRRIARTRTWALNDLYFLLRYLLRRTDVENPWIFDRIREVQASPDGHLDLWARFYYKSTIITYGLTLQNILANPEITVGIFSHTRPAAKSFLRQLKRELETNDTLKAVFPDVLYADP